MGNFFSRGRVLEKLFSQKETKLISGKSISQKKPFEYFNSRISR